MMSLRSKLFSGLFWSLVERFGTQGIQFIVTIFIARILKPADYGLIGMLAIFIAVAQSFIDSGFGSALIQKQNATQEDFSTVFYFNIIVSIFFFLLLFFTAPLIAKFYDQPLLTLITRVMSLNIVIHAFGLIQNTILTRNINFKVLTKVSLISILVSGAIGIFLAYKDFGVWALVFQTVGGSVIRVISLWLFNKWRPALIFNWNSFKSLFAYGSKLLASGLINTTFENIYKLVIGKQYSATDLGFYTQAKRIQEFPVINLYAIPQRVTFPIYSLIQNENERLKHAYRKTIKTIIFFNFPLMFGIAVLAPLLIKIFLTEKWLPSVIYLQLLCISGSIYPITGVNLNILKVKGRTDLFFYLQLIKIILLTIAIIITINLGILKIIIGHIIVEYFAFIINAYFSGRLLRYTLREQFLDIIPYFSIAGIVWLVLYFILLFIPLPDISKLIIIPIVGLFLYIILLRSLKIDIFFIINLFLNKYLQQGSIE